MSLNVLPYLEPARTLINTVSQLAQRQINLINK